MNGKKSIVVIGGGAAGFFAAINAAERFPDCTVSLLEKSNKVLSKVKISGGGRCNVTHACFDVQQLANSYPRGSKQLLQAFHAFNTKHTISWFENKGVALKAESDGRMFPQSNTSQTIIDCLLDTAQKHQVKIKLLSKINAIEKQPEGFILVLDKEEKISCNKLIVATGGSAKIQDYDWLKKLGHTIINPVPSLFTFNIPDAPITELMGVSVQDVKISVSGTKLQQQGSILITHWGFSGPAVLKLSAWGAQQLNALNYIFEVRINWLPSFNFETLLLELQHIKSLHAKQQITTRPWNEIPRRLWEYFIQKAELKETLKWSEISKKQANKLVEIICNDTYQSKGKTTFKEEFVTCGGVCLDEVDFKTMKSKKCDHLFFAGEVLDIDGITGGFNFQAAWTTGWIAANNV